MNRRWRRIAILGGTGVALLALGLAGRAALRGLGSSEVPTAAAERGDFVHRVWAEGTLEAARATNLGPPPMVRGQMRIAWLVPDGTPVQAGDVVIRFDPTEMELRLHDGETERAAAEARITKTQVREESGTRNLARDAEIAAVELEHAREFQSKDPTVFSRVDIAKSAIDARLAEKRREHAEEVRGIRGELAQAEIDLLAIERQKAELKIAQAQGDLRALEVRAPHAGIFTLREGWQGRAKVGSLVWSGSPLAELPQLDVLEARVYVLEADAGGLEVGATARVTIDAHPDRVYEATVARVDALAQPRNRQSPLQYFATRLALRGADPRWMKPGQRVQATIVLEERSDVITVPRQAVFEREGKQVLFVRRGGRFEAVEARLGPAGLGRQVVESGLEAGELVALQDPDRPAGTARPAREAAPAVAGAGS